MPPISQSITLFLLVLLAKFIATKISPHEPLSAFTFFCQQLANKVNKTSNSQKQQKIAGFIATLVTLTPLVIILWLFESFVAIPILWQGLLLYLALGGFGVAASATKIARAVTANDNYQAKQLLTPLVLRDTDQLSPIGISKTTIEMIFQKSLQQQFIVGFYFLFLGPLAALTYRLLLEMHYCWNIKQKGFQNFGKIINDIIKLLQWLPVRLFYLLQLLTTLNLSSILYWRLTKELFFKLDNSLVISYLAYTLEIRLGGVAMYQKFRKQSASFNDKAPQPQAKDIIYAIRQRNLIITLSVGLLISWAVLTTAAAI